MSQPSPLSAARQRAQALLGSADFAGARDVLEYAVEVGKGTSGEDDPEVLATLHQLAQLHLRADDPAAARRLLEEAYAAGQWRLGDTAPLMVEISFDLGLAAEELGNRHEARKAFTRVAGVGADVLGADHWAVRQARAYLGDDPSAAAQAPTNPQNLNPQNPTRYASQQPPPTPIEHSAPIEHTPLEPTTAIHQPAPHELPPRIQHQREQPGPVQQVRHELPPPIQHQAEQPGPVQQDRHELPPPIQHQAEQPGPVQQDRVGKRDHQVEPPLAVQQQTPFEPPEAARSALTEPTITQLPVWPQPAPPSSIQHIVPTEPAATSPQPYRRRGVALYAAIAASLAAIIAVVALVFVLADRGDGDKGTDNVPTLSGAPPTDVRLTDNGSSIDVTWTDPAFGKSTFMITMAHPGELLKPVTQVGPGQTSYRLTGLSTKLDYCFVVVAVYGTDTFAKSALTCTSRPGTR